MMAKSSKVMGQRMIYFFSNVCPDDDDKCSAVRQVRDDTSGGTLVTSKLGKWDEGWWWGGFPLPSSTSNCALTLCSRGLPTGNEYFAFIIVLDFSTMYFRPTIIVRSDNRIARITDPTSSLMYSELASRTRQVRRFTRLPSSGLDHIRSLRLRHRRQVANRLS